MRRRRVKRRRSGAALAGIGAFGLLATVQLAALVDHIMSASDTASGGSSRVALHSLAALPELPGWTICVAWVAWTTWAACRWASPL
jgi:hypothetical protein